MTIIFKIVFTNGTRDTPISLIDTVRFDDPERDADTTINFDFFIIRAGYKGGNVSLECLIKLSHRKFLC